MSERTRHARAARGARPVVGDLARWDQSRHRPSVDAQRLPRRLRARRSALSLSLQPPQVHLADERAVEVPVAQALVDRHAPDRVLEIGNVLSHYRPQQHVVVDKYEQAAGVLNRDVLDLGGLGRFD